MQKYASGICAEICMHKYAKICNGKCASNMQGCAQICSTKYMHSINLQIYAKYMQVYALYDNKCNAKYMHKYEIENMQKICKNMN